jgi:hypothetical protein
LTKKSSGKRMQERGSENAQGMRRRMLWLVASIAGGVLALVGLGGGLLTLMWSLTFSGVQVTAAETLPVAGMIAVGLGFGLPLVWHGVSGWRERPSRPFDPSRVWSLWLAWALLIGLGAAVSSLSLSVALWLPPIHVLTMSLPPLIVLWSVGRVMRGVGGSWREVVAIMTGGGVLSLGLSLVGELVVGCILVVAATIVMLAMPGGEEQIAALSSNLQDPVWLADMSNWPELLLSPVIACSVLGMFSIPVPLIEETFKTLATGVAARWVQPRPARAFLWGVAGGAGFALAENLFNGALGGAEGWAMGAVARLGATMMHCATGGLVGWGWGQLWTERRPLRLLGSYIAATVIHGVWNAATVSAALLSVGALAHEGDRVWLAIAGLGILVVMGLLGALTVLFVCTLHWAGRKLATEIEQFPTETAGLMPMI